MIPLGRIREGPKVRAFLDPDGSGCVQRAEPWTAARRDDQAAEELTRFLQKWATAASRATLSRLWPSSGLLMTSDVLQSTQLKPDAQQRTRESKMPALGPHGSSTATIWHSSFLSPANQMQVVKSTGRTVGSFREEFTSAQVLSLSKTQRTWCWRFCAGWDT